MTKFKISKANEKITEKVVNLFEKIKYVFVDSYFKIEYAFINHYLIKDGETVLDAKKRLKKKHNKGYY